MSRPTTICDPFDKSMSPPTLSRLRSRPISNVGTGVQRDALENVKRVHSASRGDRGTRQDRVEGDPIDGRRARDVDGSGQIRGVEPFDRADRAAIDGDLADVDQVRLASHPVAVAMGIALADRGRQRVDGQFGVRGRAVDHDADLAIGHGIDPHRALRLRKKALGLDHRLRGGGSALGEGAAGSVTGGRGDRVRDVPELDPEWVPSTETTLTAWPPRIVWDAAAWITRNCRLNLGAFCTNGGTLAWKATPGCGCLRSPVWVARYWCKVCFESRSIFQPTVECRSKLRAFESGLHSCVHPTCDDPSCSFESRRASFPHETSSEASRRGHQLARFGRDQAQEPVRSPSPGFLNWSFYRPFCEVVDGQSQGADCPGVQPAPIGGAEGVVTIRTLRHQEAPESRCQGLRLLRSTPLTRSARPSAIDPDITHLLPAFRRKRPAQVEPDTHSPKLPSHGSPLDAVMVAKLFDLTKESPGDCSANDPRLSTNQLDHKQRPRLESCHRPHPTIPSKIKITGDGKATLRSRKRVPRTADRWPPLRLQLKSSSGIGGPESQEVKVPGR